MLRKIYNPLKISIKRESISKFSVYSSGINDLNVRPLSYEPDELPTAPPRDVILQRYQKLLNLQIFFAIFLLILYKYLIHRFYFFLHFFIFKIVKIKIKKSLKQRQNLFPFLICYKRDF